MTERETEGANSGGGGGGGGAGGGGGGRETDRQTDSSSLNDVVQSTVCFAFLNFSSSRLPDIRCSVRVSWSGRLS